MFDEALLAVAARRPEPMVRRRAALAIGRIGDVRGIRILFALLEDPVPAVRQDAAFAFGLIGDRNVVASLRELVLATPPSEQDATHVEIVAAIARIGGDEAALFFEQLLVRWVGRAIAGDGLPATVIRALGEAWRLEEAAPAERLVQYAESRSGSARSAALYSLAKLRAVVGANALIRGLDDTDPQIRAIAARSLTAPFADSAGIDRGGISRRLAPLTEDDDPRVRINALRSLGSYDTQSLVPAVANGLSDINPNTRIQALAALGSLGGIEAERLLVDYLASGTFAERRQALIGLARVARDVALVRCAGWIISNDWLLRSAGIEALAIIGGDTALTWLQNLVSDADPRVVSGAFSAIVEVDSVFGDQVARDLVLHSDAVVSALAAGRIAKNPNAADVELLVEAYERSLRYNGSQVRVEVVEALGAARALGLVDSTTIKEEFLQRFPDSDDYLVRRAAADTLPAAAAGWGPIAPIDTKRNPEDYRDIASRLVLPAEQRGEYPEVVIETERGEVIIRLFSAEAPITVDAMLQLADRHYFDGGIWHRVVPNFIAQTGNPRGDGWGGPGFYLRDETSRRRYVRGTVGMASSGPDTGGSQFFVTYSPQPHLDGTFTVIGRVDHGMDVVDRITQGERIRTIRRR